MNKLHVIWASLMAFFWTSMAFAAEAAAGLPILDKIMEWVPTGGTAVVVGAAVLEFAMRLVKTDKPVSIAWGVVAIMRQLIDLLDKLADFLDQVLPQRTDPAPEPGEGEAPAEEKA